MNKTIKTSPRYPTGVVADYLNVKTKTLINFENAGLTRVAKNERNRRLYSQEDVLRVIMILHLLNEEGLNYKGCELILKLIWYKKIDFEVLSKIIPRTQIGKMVQKAIDI
ncbi:MAG: MerR family transcriptional regulator [Patescibacteria group bacterium]|nr:MerR family transcriptional regulator [Patescibacteria group bacterium]